MIKNIIFDMGGVLIYWNPIEFAKKVGFDNPEEIVHLIYETGIWSGIDAGKYPAAQGHKIIIDSLPNEYKEGANKMIEDWQDLSYPIPGILELIKHIKEAGYNIYLLSNAGDDHPSYWSNYPYKPYFDGLYVSAFHKKTKPHPEVYSDFINTFNLNKEECIFIDDVSDNVDAANKFGILSFHFKGDTEGLITILKDYINI